MRRHLFLFIVTATLLGGIVSCGGSSASPPPVVTVTATVPQVVAGGSVAFSVTVKNTTNQSVTWAVSGGSANGTISQSGLFTAPALVPNPAQVTITATSQADSAATGTASITVIVGIVVTPPSAVVQTLGITPFSATIQGSSNQAVTWEVNGIPGGSPSVGTISPSGSFQAPESVPANASSGQTTSVTVEAIAQASPTATGTASVTVTSPNQRGQNLPIKLGTSGGNANNVNTRECESGTLGSLVTRAGTQFILSNNHVLADSDAGSVGDVITQPGLIDTSSPCVAAEASTVAHLSQFINIQAANPPADAAIAQVVSGAVDTSGAIIELGDSAPGGVPADEAPSSTVLPVASLVPNSTAVAKSGRSTGLTCSTIEAIGLTISVQYTKGLGGPSFTATYTNQVGVNGGTFSAAGDSGSLIVSQASAEPIALLYAGSTMDTIGAPAQTVLNSLADPNNAASIPSFVGTSNHVVAGCTSSGADAFDATAQTTASPSAAELSSAEAVKNQNTPQLMTEHPAVLAVGVAGSLDRPDRAAIILFMRKGEPLVRPIPHNVAGVPTRVISVDSLPKNGALDQQSTATFVKSAGAPGPATPTPADLAAAKTVKEKYAASLMQQPGILGVGVTSSLDNPSEAAVMVFVEAGKPHNPIPLELDGVRVRVKSTDKFRAYGWGHPKPH